MWDEIRDGLNSLDPRDRDMAWRELREAVRENRIDLNAAQLLSLLEAIDSEDKDPQWKQGVETLLMQLIHGAAAPKDQGTRSRGHRPNLADWFWDLFREPTAVLRIYDDLRRRDEDAATELARLLPRPDFRQTKFIQVPTTDQRWDQLVRPNETVCIVGRIGIFGEKAVTLFDTDTTHFFFPTQLKPDSIRPGWIDPENFHRICERRDGVIIDKPYAVHATQEDGRDRIDFGLVQRYYQPEKQRHVVVLAGNSRLGTLGTIQFLAGLAEQDIPLPDGGLGERETLEVLIRVRAAQTPHPVQWTPDTPTTMCLHAGREHRWFPEERCWGPQRLVLKMPDGDPVGVYLNEHQGRATYERGSDMVRFIHALWDRTDGGTPGISVPDDGWQQYEDVAKRLLHDSPTYRRRLGKLKGAIAINEATSEVTLRVPIDVV